MAFTTPYALPSGLVVPAAYVNILVHSNKNQTTCICNVFASEEAKEAGLPTVCNPIYHQFDKQDMECVNPLEYGYKLLEASGEFPEATWNV